MARKAYGLHATQVNLGTHPDDGTSPVGSAEWNAALDNEGMLGFTPQTANSSTIIVASGVATITDSVSIIAAESSTTDTLQKLALANTSQYDLVYLFADTGDTITLEHGDLNADGEVSTVSGSDETLSTTVPTILIRKGNYWYGYGGGVVNAVSDIGDVTITSNSAGELLKWSGSAWINQTLTEAGIVDGNLGTPSTLVGTNITGTAASLTAGNATLAAGATALASARTIGGTSFDGTAAINIANVIVADTTNTSCSVALFESATGNTLAPKTDGGLTYNAGTGILTATAFAGPITGNVTGDTSGVADNVVGLAELASGTDGELFTWDASGDPAKVAVGTATHVLTSNGVGVAPTFQAASGGGISGNQDYSGTHSIHDLQTLFLEHQSSSFDDSGNDRADESQLFVKQIDSNNDGLYIRLRRNGSTQNVQIA